MNVLLKALGMVTLFFSSCILGFSEAEKLKKRVKKLSRFLRAASEYAERVQVGTEEVDRLLFLCFGEEWIEYTNDGFSVLPGFAKKEDAELANEFFHNIGMGDTGHEAKRAKMFIVLFEKRLSEAEKDAQERCRLFQTLGVLGGVFLCIFLL